MYFSVEERVVVPPKPKGERQSFAKLMGSLFTNRALLGIVIAALLLLLGNLFNGSVASFLWLDYFKQGQMQATASIIATVPPSILILLAKPLVKKFGKTEMGIFGVVLYVATMLVQYFLRTDNVWVFIVLYTIASFGIAIFNYLIWAMIVDVIDYQEVRSGERDDATVYAVYSWARKLGQAASIGLGGIALGMIGYQAAKPGQPPVTPPSHPPPRC